MKLSCVIAPAPVVRPRERRRTARFWLRDFAPWAAVGISGTLGIGGGAVLLALSYLRAFAPGVLP